MYPSCLHSSGTGGNACQLQQADGKVQHGLDIMDNQCKGQVSDRDLMWAQEILQCCSWLPSVAYLRSGGVLVIQAQITCHTAQYALTQLHWLPLLGMKTREAQA